MWTRTESGSRAERTDQSLKNAHHKRPLFREALFCYMHIRIKTLHISMMPFIDME